MCKIGGTSVRASSLQLGLNLVMHVCRGSYDRVKVTLIVVLCQLQSVQCGLRRLHKLQFSSTPTFKSSMQDQCSSAAFGPLKDAACMDLQYMIQAFTIHH
jgi:hypothetical protein